MPTLAPLTTWTIISFAAAVSVPAPRMLPVAEEVARMPPLWSVTVLPEPTVRLPAPVRVSELMLVAPAGAAAPALI